MKYFVISNSNGDTYIEQMNEAQLIQNLEDGDYDEFIGNLKESDPNYWGDGVLIIKGEIVVPKPKEIIKTFEL